MPDGPLKAFRGAVLAAAVVGAAAAGCSNAGDASLTSPPSTARVTPTTGEGATTTVPAPPPTAVAGPDPCTSSALAVEAGEGRSALGRGLYVFELRNTSPRRCQLLGYPAAVVVDAGGSAMAEAVPAAGRLLSDRAPSPVVVSPGAAAFVGLEAATVCNEGARPSSSRTIRLTPPNQSEGPLTVEARLTVCPGQAVLVSPVRASEPDITR